MRDPEWFSTRELTASSLVRSRNRGEVWRAMRSGVPLSLGELANQTGLSRATISAITREMLQTGIVEPLGPASSSGGRPPALFRYRPEARLAAGVVMFDDQIAAVLTDLEGRPLRYIRHPWQGTDARVLLQRIVEVVTQLLAGYDRERLLGFGVGLPGVIDVPSGQVLLCISMGWMGEPIPVRSELTKALGLPVFVANRSRMAALGELRTGVGRGLDSLLYLFLGKGVVSGLAFARGIYFGASSTAGEIGHTTLVPDGPLCSCGNRGCLELYTSESAIVAAAIERGRADGTSLLRRETHGNLQLLTIDTVLACAREGDPAAVATLDEVGAQVGLTLASALNMFNPQMLVIGGPIGTKAGPLLLDPITRELERRTLPLTLAAVQVVTGSPEDECAVLGAAALVLDAVSVDHIFRLDGN